MKEKLSEYKVVGKIYVWNYLENYSNYPGWNLTLDMQASISLIRVLNLMLECDWLNRKSILLEKPTQLQLSVPNNRNGLAKWKSKNKLILNYKKLENENYWRIKETEKEIHIDFGESKLKEFKNAITRISKGMNDFPICDEKRKHILYFWCNMENKNEA